MLRLSGEEKSLRLSSWHVLIETESSSCRKCTEGGLIGLPDAERIFLLGTQFVQFTVPQVRRASESVELVDSRSLD